MNISIIDIIGLEAAKVITHEEAVKLAMGKDWPEYSADDVRLLVAYGLASRDECRTILRNMVGNKLLKD